jgi:hypothetical protein
MSASRRTEVAEKSAPLVVVFPRDQLSPGDKARMQKVGIIAVEADDPKMVVQLQLAHPLILSAAGVSSDAFVRALLTAISEQEPATSGGTINTVGRACHSFVKQLAAAMGDAPK